MVARTQPMLPHTGSDIDLSKPNSHLDSSVTDIESHVELAFPTVNDVFDTVNQLVVIADPPEPLRQMQVGFAGI